MNMNPMVYVLILITAFISTLVGCEEATQRNHISVSESTVTAKEIIEPSSDKQLAKSESITLATISPEPTVSIVPSTSYTNLYGPNSANAVSVSSDGTLVVAVNPDSDSITLVDALTLAVVAEIPVGDNPRTISITPDSKTAIVTNHGSATLSKVDLDLALEVKQYPVGSMPYGVVTDGIHAYVTEFGLGTLSIIDLTAGDLLMRIPVDPFPAGIALSPDGQNLLITHFFTGRLTVIDQQTSTVSGTASTGEDTNLSQFIAISPDGKKAYLPQTRSNTTNTNLLFDTTVFPVVNVVDLDNLQLLVQDRITLDTADEPVNMPFSIVLSTDGETLYLANAGSDDVSVINLQSNKGVAHISVGANPRGITITPDGSRVFVNNVLDGTLSVIDTEIHAVTDVVKITQISMASSILLGKKLFNSAAAPTLSTDNWISCATCHFDGSMDSRTWLGFPDGPRNTPALFGVAETLPIHWSGDFDELQDVEITIEDIQFGNGLIKGEAHDSLGPPHSGLSPTLDALAVYLASIKTPPSLQKNNRDDLVIGAELFGTLGCNTCHIPPLFTDLKLHDVGTGSLTDEKNSHGQGTMFDTPSLRGAWLTAPYFHNGSAATFEQVLRTGTSHNVFDSIDDSELKALIRFIRELPDGNLARK